MEVHSRDGHNVKHYFLHITQEAEALNASDFQDITLTYGEESSVAQEKVAIEFITEGVARVSRGKIVAIGAGTTRAKAYLPEEGNVEASAPVTFTVTVEKASRAITPESRTLPFGTRYMEPQFDWSTLVMPSDSTEIKGELGYKLYDSSGEEVTTTGWLPAGIYTWRATSTPKETEDYKLTLEEGTFTITSDNQSSPLISVADETNSAIEGALVELTLVETGETIASTADSEGRIALTLPLGEYAYLATKEGYATKEGTLSVSSGASDHTITLSATTITLTFTAGANGALLTNPYNALS